MVVAGTVTVNPDGTVKNYTLYKSEGLPSGVAQIVGRTVPGLHFVPMAGDTLFTRDARFVLKTPIGAEGDHS